MTTHHISEIKHWFKEAVPSPNVDNVQVQIGCHMEEVAEMFEAMSFENSAWTTHKVADQLKAKEFPYLDIDRIKLLDSLCDQIVTAIGVAHMLGMDIDGALNEVNKSNWSKFRDGKAVFNDQGKIAKNKETFFRPDLTPFV